MILYTNNKKGKAQSWEVVVEGDSFYTLEGLVGGKITKSKPTKCIGKNIGKSNETSPEEQAIIEAAAKHKRKLEKGYSETLETSGKTYFEVMLAEDYKDKATGVTHSWVDKLMKDPKIRKFVQPKLDGIRAINENMSLASREGKPFISCPHLLVNDVTLDGEMYNHSFKHDFNAIVSLIKQPKPTKEDLERTKELAEMWVYDFPGVKEVFSKRYDALKTWFKTNKNSSLKLVETHEIKDEEELKLFHKNFLDKGFEGTIIRFDLGEYENKRSEQLVKYKDFIDEEFEILDSIEGKGGRAGTIGKFILKHDKYPGETFKSNVKGNFDYLREVWKNRESYVGKQATVQYFNRTPRKNGKGDVPRFGYVVKIDRKSYE